MLTDQEKRRAVWREWYHRNKEKYAASQRQWIAKNPEKRKASSARWREKHKEDIRRKANEKLHNLNGFLARKLSHLKKTKIRSHSKTIRILDFSISVLDLLKLWDSQNGKCAISGYPMTYPKSTLFTLSVDRIDPNGGYTTDNVQLVCQGINFAKNKYSNAEMLEFWNFGR